MYLRGCKFSYEKVKQKIDMWHTVRTHCPDLFEDWSWKDPKMKELQNIVKITITNVRTKERLWKKPKATPLKV